MKLVRPVVESARKELESRRTKLTARQRRVRHTGKCTENEGSRARQTRAVRFARDRCTLSLSCVFLIGAHVRNRHNRSNRPARKGRIGAILCDGANSAGSKKGFLMPGPWVRIPQPQALAGAVRMTMTALVSCEASP
jgi:hypothetical protein